MTAEETTTFADGLCRVCGWHEHWPAENGEACGRCGRRMVWTRETSVTNLAVLRRLAETGYAVDGIPLEPYRSTSLDRPFFGARYWFCGGDAPMASGHAPGCPWLELIRPLLEATR